jgi:hypothetical protein
MSHRDSRPASQARRARLASLPRVQSAASTGDVPRMLSVGSLVWWHRPFRRLLFVWTAQQASLDRQHWLASIAANSR